MTTVLLIISILLTASVTGAAIRRLGELPESISALVYVFRHKWMWVVWMWAVSFLTLIPAISSLDRVGMGFLGFGTLVCLLFCAAMPIFMKDKKHVHDILGISGGILSQCCVLFIDPNWLFTWSAFVFVMGSVYVQPQGKLAKAVEHKGVFVAECVYGEPDGGFVINPLKNVFFLSKP